MSYRPITDLWILGRPKVKYYGAYPGGFVHRARALLGVGPADPILHVCGGKVRDYPFRGVGPDDRTLDVREDLGADYVCDLTAPGLRQLPVFTDDWRPAAILADPPYTPTDAKEYGPAAYPSASLVMRVCLASVFPGQRVGLLHYEWPACPSWAREVAVVGVTTGRRQRMRTYTVMERV